MVHRERSFPPRSADRSMPSLEQIISWLRDLPPIGVYVALWFTTYIENVFPPSPSDAVMLFIATLIGIGTIGLVPAIAVATVGSVSGFMTAFWIGRRYGRRIVRSERLPFVTPEALTKVDAWFDRWGYWVIVANRFLSGTRAVISFFAGLSRLRLDITTLLCTISALIWNILIIVAGWQLGSNWREAESVIRNYGLVVTLVIAAVALFFFIRWLVRRNQHASGERNDGDGTD